MTQLGNIAKPYAKALFQIAKYDASEKSWASFLEDLVYILAADSVKNALNHPNVNQIQINDIILTLTNTKDKKQIAFIKLLSQYHRLYIVSEILEQYNTAWLDEKNIIKASVITASVVTKTYLNNLTKSLSKTYNKDIVLENSQDKSLIGGAIIKVGDKVTDGSIRNKLDGLKKQLLTD